MNKELKNLQSEKIANDGSYKWGKLIDEANERLKQIGSHGKRATIKKVKPGKAMSIQFKVPGRTPPQFNPGINLDLNKNNLIEAEKICTLVTSRLMAGDFTYDWFYSLVGKVEKVAKPEKPLTCGEMLEQYKVYYFKQRKDYKNPSGTWTNGYANLEKVFLKHKDSPITLEIITKVIDCTSNNTPSRQDNLNGLANLLKYFDNDDFKKLIKRYKSENNPKPKTKHIPMDTEIANIYQNGFNPLPNCPKHYLYRYAQWQFLYSLLAIYGLRIHEAWNIKNWDKPVTLKAGDYIAIASDNDTEDEINNDRYKDYRIVEKDDIVYPVLDTINNPHHILCIGHDTKTGYREAFPISPSGAGIECDWIDKFNLLQPLNLPDIPSPLEYCPRSHTRRCTKTTNHWFRPKSAKNEQGKRICKSRFGFTPHALRHAYNIRGHNLGINQKILADSLGHGLHMNSTTYMKHERLHSKRKGMVSELDNKSIHKTQLEQSLERITYLEDKVKYLESENNELRTRLRMYEAINSNLP